MSNSVEAALARSSQEQREKAQQVIEEARRNIRLVSVQQMDDISSSSADSVAHQARVIEEAKRSIPFETMQDVNEVSMPRPTPSFATPNSKMVELNPDMHSNVEVYGPGTETNDMQPNAVDQALARQTQEIHAPQQEQTRER